MDISMFSTRDHGLDTRHRQSLYSRSQNITSVRTQERWFELIDDNAERDLFALPDVASNIARPVCQIVAHGNWTSIVRNQRQLPADV